MKQIFSALIVLVLTRDILCKTYPTVLTPLFPNSTSLKDIKSYSSNQVVIGASDKWGVYSIATASFTSTLPVTGAEFVECSGWSNTSTILVLLNNGMAYSLEVYSYLNQGYTRSQALALDSAVKVNSLTVSSDFSSVVYTQASTIKVVRKNSSQLYDVSQNITLTGTLYDSALSSSGTVLVAASPTTLYYYSYNTLTSLYESKQTITLQPALANNNTKGILSLSNDGETLVYVTYQSKLNIAKLSSSSFTTSQTIQLTNPITQLKISQQSWLIIAVVGTTKIMVYANITGQYSFVQEYTTSDNIVMVDLSNDNNYLLVGTQNTSAFQIRVNTNLHQKKMMNNAEIILFTVVFVTVALLFAIYCISTRCSRGNLAQVEVLEGSKMDYLDAEDTEMEITRKK